MDERQLGEWAAQPGHVASWWAGGGSDRLGFPVEARPVDPELHGNLPAR